MAETKEKEFPDWRILSAAKFAETYSEGCRNGQRFCFVLGSGASVESGIRIRGSLEYDWMKCLMGEELDKGTPAMNVEETREFAEKLRKDGKLQHEFSVIEDEWNQSKAEGRHTLSSEYYFDIYKLRFYPNSKNGYRYLERLMEHADPSFGYHPLARLLTDEYNNNLVITTNFDSLVEDALFLYTDQKPLTINHELTADYIEDHSIRRPIIAKLHRGLFFDPLNDPEDTVDLKGNWKKVLKEIFHIYTPVVIGYGGGDQSLMSLLEEEDLDLPKGIYWCYMDKYGLPGKNIRKLMTNKNGYFVQTEGFDHIMLILGNKMCPDQITPGKTLEYLENQMNRRMKRYSEQIRELEEKGKEKGSEKLGEGIEEFNKNEAEEREERREKDEMTAYDYWSEGFEFYCEHRYREAIESFNKVLAINPHYGDVYEYRGESYENLKEYDKALDDYNKNCQTNPRNFFAFYRRGELYRKRKSYAEALEDFTTAIRLYPCASVYESRGSVYAEQGDYEKALRDYTEAIKLDPKYGVIYSNRAKVYRKMGLVKEAEADERKWYELHGLI